jgi:hypothetical protein
VKGWTLTSGGRVGSTIVMQFVVIEEVALGFMRRMLIVECAILRVSFGGELCVRPDCTVVLFPVGDFLIDLLCDHDASTICCPGGRLVL